MNKILIGLVAALMSFSAMAQNNSAAESEVRNTVTAFNGAYANNNVDAYFSHYTDDATVYFYGARQNVAAYHEEWAKMVDAGGAVEKVELADLQVQVMPSGDVAVATYFVGVRMRVPGGVVSESKAFESEVWQKIGGKWKVVSLHYTEIPAE